MTVDSILEKIQYNYDDIDNDFNEYTYLTSREYNVLINEYKNNNNIKAYNFLYANSFVIYKSIYYKRYHNSMYGLKTKDSFNEEDVFEKAFNVAASYIHSDLDEEHDKWNNWMLDNGTNLK